MNERIRQIRQEAWAFVKHDLETVERDHVVMYSEHLEMHYAKFAELIVRECCAIADEVERADMDSYVSKYIRAHFGIE